MTIEQKDYDFAVKLLRDLVKVNTVNPPGNEIALEPIVKEAYEKLGMTVEIVEKEKGRANFIGKIGNGKPSIGFFPHLDTVPAGDGWKTNPFEPTEKDGKLYARGVIDCKGNFVSSWLAIKGFLRTHKKLTGTIYLLGCADEEMGSEKGVEYLLAKGFRVDYAIVPDGGHLNKIIIGEKGVVRYTVKSYGKQAHGSLPEHGINAISYLISFLNELESLSLKDLSYDPLFSGVTRNIGVIKGGHAVNIVPAYAEAEVDIRFPYPLKKEDITERVESLCKEFIAKNKKAKIEIEDSLYMPSHLTSKDSELVKAFLVSAKELGRKIHIGTMGGITDAKHLALYGIPTLVHSMDEGEDTAHMANEFVKLENIKIASALYERTLEKLFAV